MNITPNLVHRILISSDEQNMFLYIDYMQGKYIIEKIYKNNTFSLEEMNFDIQSFNSEKSIIKHFNIGDKNEQA